MNDHKYKKVIPLLFYIIDNGIITRDEIREWADQQILITEDVPYFLIELSMAKSLDEMFGILNNESPYEKISYANINIKSIISLINNYYKKTKNIQDTIKFIYQTKNSLNLSQQSLYDIYMIDHNREMYIEKQISRKELISQLNSFFSKYTYSGCGIRGIY